MAQQITENMIREAAYFLWEKAGRPDGSAEYFWMKACEQFFKPKKVVIKKLAAKKAVVKKTPTKKPVVKKAPVKKVAAPVKRTVPAKKPAVKVAVKPVAKSSAKPVKKVVINFQTKPTSGSTTSVPFYGSRK